MWLKKFIYFVSLFCLIHTGTKSQTNPPTPDSAITGVWKGTSICQVKNSPCHDEIVVYHISREKGVDSFSIVANKIVDGKEDEMGTLHFQLNRATSQLIAHYNGVWTLNIKGRSMDGILTTNGTLYRIIKLIKQ